MKDKEKQIEGMKVKSTETIVISGGRASGKTYYAISELTKYGRCVVLGINERSGTYFKTINNKIHYFTKKQEKLVLKILETHPDRIIIDEFSFKEDFELYKELRNLFDDIILVLRVNHGIRTYRDNTIYISY